MVQKIRITNAPIADVFIIWALNKKKKFMDLLLIENHKA